MKIKKIVASLLCCVLSLGALTGCGSVLATTTDTDTPKVAVCFVVGAHSNSQGLNFNTQLVEDTLYEAFRGYGYVSVVSCDGDPAVTYSESCDIDDYKKNASATKLDSDAEDNTNNLLSTMANVYADDPEVDYLCSLQLAVRTLSSLSGYDTKEIVVIGTGLSTTGVLDFTNNLISAEAEVIVEMLQERSEIPDFSGISVYWQQMGDVAEPQEELTSAQREKLEAIYRGIVEAGGGTFVIDTSVPTSADTTLELPFVSTVELPEETPIAFDTENIEDAGDVLKDGFFLSEEQVTFVANSAEFLSPDEAAKTLEPLAELLLEHSTTNILICGCTAGDEDDESGRALSLARAEAVKAALVVSLGVDGERITACGLGSSDPWHISGAGYEGALAASNRKVVILDSTSETAVSILSALQ